eukprot:TRINITY_DN802_c0_g2_i1.p1 TRINITY_DN802_c0_g2~~TRINITY_DN802_c0_g2_i1.p1  ORF type:complete len:258 (-),score=46.70 TRINITY_DN802_c0_g2_i1:246-920(-)
MLGKAEKLGLNIKGLCFHVGSQCKDPDMHVYAIESCRRIFDDAIATGINIGNILDIGGGFPISYNEPVMDINEFCNPINQALDSLFPDPNMHLIAEPGRFVAGPAMTLACSVIGKSERQGIKWYYLDDGVYNSYSGKIFDHAEYEVEALKSLITENKNNNDDEIRYPSVLAGPTCDSFDVVYDGIMMPELDIGDILVSPNMGAYTSASATHFNHFEPASIVLID